MSERMQADGGGDQGGGQSDGTNVTPGAGESGGGARPGKEAHGDGGSDAGFMGHGGQSDIAYRGPEQPGAEKVEPEQPNAATR